MLNKQNELVREQITQAVQTQFALQTAVAYANSTSAVEEWARTDGHYIQDGDLPVVPVEEPGSAPIIFEHTCPRAHTDGELGSMVETLLRRITAS